ncbi:hypothetical protein [Alkalihalobacterium bogoriense]|uniref:hypothetical protein n=1 Tax=Alkalihalobacterium bogoriense TaxID=246272 RepID=UPI000686713C|nr:hypothetical protein [Alkalihalobacterium bogoriense]
MEQTREELLKETFESAKEYSKTLHNGIGTFIEKFAASKYEEGINLLPAIIDGLEWLLKASVLTESLQKEKLEIESMNKILNEINEALEHTDYILLSDIMQYEIAEKIEMWRAANFSN